MQKKSLAKALVLSLAFLILGVSTAGAQEKKLLHVSFDISREVFKALDKAFEQEYQKQTGTRVRIEQSHAGSSKQARAVSEGLNADLVSMNQYLDIEFIVDESQGRLIPNNWQSLNPNQASPFSSTMVFVVRKGNPKKIKDWADLARPGVSIVAPNYKTTGNGRYSWLSAWAWAQETYKGDVQKSENFLSDILKNTPLMASGGRDASTVFIDREQGDVLLTFEAEAHQIVQNFAKGDYEIVVPSLGLDAKIYVATVKPVAQEKGNSAVAEAYWKFIYSPKGQEIIAQQFFRPLDTQIAAKYRATFPALKLLSIEELYGSWDEANKKHFERDGIFDRLAAKLGR